MTGTGAPSPDTAYMVTALAQLPLGTGVVLAATVDQEQCVVGDSVTITATVTADGVPVTDATVTAQVTDPGGATTTWSWPTTVRVATPWPVTGCTPASLPPPR